MKKLDDELLLAINEIEELKAELSAQKSQGIKPPPMEKLNYLFTHSQKKLIKKVSSRTEMQESDVARAAMLIGLKQLEELGKDDNKKSKGMIHISKLRLMLLK